MTAIVKFPDQQVDLPVAKVYQGDLWTKDNHPFFTPLVGLGEYVGNSWLEYCLAGKCVEEGIAISSDNMANMIVTAKTTPYEVSDLVYVKKQIEDYFTYIKANDAVIELFIPMKATTEKKKKKKKTSWEQTVIDKKNRAAKNKPKYELKTQKAKGIQVIAEMSPMTLSSIKYVTKREQIDGLHLNSFNKWFARPCPIKPVHGFVDSQEVKTLDDVKRVFDEAKAADSEAELVIMPLIAADFNMVYTPGLLTIGPGHDGATAGKQCVNIPWGTTKCDALQLMSNQAGVSDGDQPFLEAVTEGQQTFLTQLRAGPPIQGLGPNFIVKGMIVKKVVPAKGDLLEWADTISKIKDTDGVIVWHPEGSMASHYAIHCVLHKVPYVTTFEPEVGMTLAATEQRETTYDADAMLSGLTTGLLFKFNAGNDINPTLKGALQLLHQATALTGSDTFWLGVGAAIMLRCGTAACMGEARHAHSHKVAGFTNGPRDRIYKKVIKGSYRHHRHSLAKALVAFRFGNWDGSFGGRPWAKCAEATIRLDDAVKHLFQRVNEDSCKNVIEAFNFAVNQAHNGGFWLDKFGVQKQFLDEVAENNYQRILKYGWVYYGLAKQRLKKREVIKYKKKWIASHYIKVADIEADIVEVDDREYNNVKVKYKDLDGQTHKFAVANEGGGLRVADTKELCRRLAHVRTDVSMSDEYKALRKPELIKQELRPGFNLYLIVDNDNKPLVEV